MEKPVEHLSTQPTKISLPMLVSRDKAVFAAYFVCRIAHVLVSHGLGGAQLNYSKFYSEENSMPGGTLPSRKGMLVLYSLSVLTSVFFLLNPYSTSLMCAVMCFIHFGKRMLECAYLHRYSGRMDLFMAVAGSVSYAIGVYVRCQYAEPNSFLTPSSLFGVLLFVVGELGNLYHHYLLSTAKRGENNEYVIPTGGWFDLVACPHYTFELMAMLGIAIYGRNMLAHLDTLCMTLYLGIRSMKTTQFYVSRFGEAYSALERKHLVPLVW